MSDAEKQPAHQRDARAAGSVVVGVIYQGVYILSQFVILAILIREVGEERLGMWVTIYSMSMWLGVLLFGMDRALMTTLGRVAFNQPAIARRVILFATGFVLIGSGIAGVAIGVFGWDLPWADQVLNVHGETAMREATPTAVLAMLMTAASIPLVLSGFILQAYQRGATRHLLGIVSQLIGLGLLLLGVYLDWPLPWLGVAIISPLLLGGAFQWVAVLWLWPAPASGGAVVAEPRPVAGHLLKTGLGLWIADVAIVLMLNSGAYVVAQAQSAADVVPYGAVYRLVGPMFVCFVVIAHSYWPAIGDAAGAQDHKWIARALRHSMYLMAGVWLIGSVGCLLLGNPFIVLWLGEEARPGIPLILAGLAFALAIGMYHLSVAALGGLGYIRVQAVVSLVTLAVYCLVMWLCIGHIDAVDVMWIQAAGIGLVGIINGVYLVARLRRTNSQTA